MRLILLTLLACGGPQGTAPPPGGWANTAPTRVEEVIDHDDAQLLRVRQGALQTWVRVPDVRAGVGDHVLLAAGTARRDVPVPELGRDVAMVVDIPHAQVVDEATAKRVIAARRPADAIPIAAVYADLPRRAGDRVTVHGTVVKAASAIGWHWVHLRDGTGSASDGTHDLTVKTAEAVREGQRVTFTGVLREDVDLGFGYRYPALVEEGTLR